MIEKLERLIESRSVLRVELREAEDALVAAARRLDHVKGRWHALESAIDEAMIENDETQAMTMGTA